MSTIKYLFDENLNSRYKATLMQRRPEIDALRVGDSGTPPRGTLDPELLVYLEQAQRILITNNRESMPDHLRDIGLVEAFPGVSFQFVRARRTAVWQRNSN